MSSDSGTSLPDGGEQQVRDVDERHYLLQAEQEGTQKKTFTNWINSQLSKCPKPTVINDLFTDLKDGHVLLDLLEVLSGEELRREKGRNVFQSRSNIESALTFLGKQSIKLINIHVEDIISGKASIVLGLIWKIILHFHIQGLAEILSNAEEQSESKNGVSPTASPPTKKSAKSRWKLSAKKVLLQWAKEKCAQNGLSNVTDFKSSWKSGLAFLAIIHSLRPDLVDMDRVKERTDEENLREAFKIAEDELKIPSLLEPEDVNVADPDEKSIMTYVAQFLQYSKSAPEPRKEIPVQVKKAIEWLNVENQALKDLFASMKREKYAKKYHEMLLYMRKFNEQKRVFLADLSMKSLPPEEQQLIKQSLENITTQIAEWKKDLDRRLPPPLNDIEVWLTDVENLSRQKLPEADNHCNTVSLLQNISTSYKALISLAANHLESIKNFKTMGDTGEILVPSDKMEELKARTLKIITSNYIVLIDYRCCGHIALALLDEAKPRLKSWTAKCKTQESVEALLADWKDFMEDRGFANHLETAFQRFQELKTQLAASDEYSNDPGILKEYESIESKYNAFLLSAQHAKSSMENVLSSWIHFENNIPLITFWLDEQQRIPPAKVPMEILAKWKSVLESLNKDGNLLIERTSGKMASKLSNKLKSVNGRWEEFVTLLDRQKELENLSKVTLDSKGDDQTLLRPSGASFVPERPLSEEDIKHNFESSKSKLESYITTATCLLKQRLTPDEFISQHEKTLGGFSSESLENFLKFADEMKHISKPNEQKTVESVSTDIRNRWKVIHSEIESYVCHLKMQVLKKRFDDLFQKMEAQVNKEKIYKEDMDLEELIRAHKILFSEDGCHGQLSSCLQEMKELCDDPKAQRDAQTGALVAECTKKKEELEERAAEVYLHLLSHQDQVKVLMKETSFGTLENWTMTEICQSNGMSSLLKVSEAAAEHSNGIICEQDTSEEPPLQKITKRCNQVKSHLENLLQHARETLVKSPRKAQDLSELQQDLQELQVLHGYIHYSWVQFETASQELENVVDAEEKIKLLEKRNLLKCDVKSTTEEITNRTKSLDITINVLLPIEYDVKLLHDTNQLSQEQEVDKFTRSYIESALKELKDVQTSLEDDIQQCDLLELSPELVDPSSPVAVQSVVHKYKVQLESITKNVSEREAVLKELENFLSSLETTKQSIDTLPMITDGKTLQEKQSKLEALEKRISRLWQDAEKLDVLLLTVNVHLEDPETGGETSCQKMVSALFGRFQTVQLSIRQVFGNFKHKDEPMMEASNQTLHPFAKEPVCLLSEANHPLQDSEMEMFTVSDIDTVLQEIKGIRGSFEEVLLSSSEIDGKSSPGVFPDEDTVHEYRMQLKSSSTNLKEREDTLKSLGIFLSSLERTKLSIEAQFVNPGMNRRALLEMQKHLEALEKDIYSLGQEAEKLDCSLHASGILLEDPEAGGPTSCQKIISGFFERVERAQEAVTKEFRNLEEMEKAKALSIRIKEFCKRIQEIHTQIDKVGLKDPTIPSVQRRMRLLVKLENELDSCAQEKLSIDECAAQLSSTAQLNELEEIEQCENLWEDAWQSVASSKEQCEKVHELLRRFQSCRTILTSLIQKAENTISQKSPYVGKENLQKMITQVETVNREFKEKSESVDEINSICKNLQFHLKKMKSFEKPPFQKEATLMVDKYLDMCDKMDNYEGHLKKAYGLWNIIINLSKSLEQWSDSKMILCEDVALTTNEVTSLNIELQGKEKHLDDISRKTKEIQIGLQLDELPLELQVIKTSLEKKMELIHMFATRASENSEAASDCHTAAKIPDPDITGEESTPDTSMLMDEAVETNGINTMASGEKERTGNGDPHIEHKVTTMEVQIAALQNKQTGRSDVSGNDTNLQEPDVSRRLENHKLKMIELRTKQELLNSNFQVGLRDKTLRLEDLKQLLKETQGLADSLKAQDPEKAIPGPGVYSDEWPQIKHDYICLLGQMQDTMQMLESRVQRHQLYESLCAALNSEMTSFSQELLNFTGSSLETTACEETRHKLQELREQFEGMERRVNEISSIAESMKPGTLSPNHTDIDETLKLYHGKMGDFMTKLKSLEDQEKGLSHVPGKRIIRKAKKVKQLPPEHMVIRAQEESAKDKKAAKARKKKKVLAESSSEEKVKLDDQPVKETAIPVNLANMMDYKAQVVSVPSSGTMCHELKWQDQSIQEVIVPVNQEDTMDHNVQVLPELQCGSVGSDIDQSQENIHNLLEWLHNARIKLQILKETSCEEHQLKEKLNAVENMCCEITQKKIDLDVTGVTGETVEEKLLQEATDVGKEQEAIGQVENLLRDCDWYRRQLEISLNDLTAFNQDVHRISCLLSSLEERLCGRKVLLSDVEKADILKDVQPLYEDVKAYIVSVERAVTQAAGLNISLKAKKDIAMITETYERLTNKMSSLSSSNGDMVTAGEHTSDGEHIETQEDPDLSFKAPDFLLVEDVNAHALHEKVPPPSPEFLEPGDEDGSSGELQIQLSKHQQDLEEILPCVQGLLQSDFPDKQPRSTETKLQWLLNEIKCWYVGEHVKGPPEEKPGMLTKEGIEQKLCRWKKLPLDLDDTVTELLIHDIENVYEEMTKLEFPESYLNNGTSSFQRTGDVVGGPSFEHFKNWRGTLLFELETLKIQKQNERQAIKDYQNALRTSKSSLKRLTKELENLKMGPSEIHTDHLDKILNFLNKLSKEKDTLHNLKAEQAKICSYGVSHLDIKKVEMDVKQIEESWEQIELMVEKKRDDLAKTAEELGFLKQKVDHVQHMIKELSILLDQASAPPQEPVKASLFLASDLQAAKHSFSSLRNVFDLQMKRSWGQSECRSLENSLDDLQSQLENVEHRASEVQQTTLLSSDIILENHTFLKPLYEALLWVKKLSSHDVFEHTIALLPEDVAEQILDCNSLQNEIIGRKSTVVSIIENSKQVRSSEGVVSYEEFNSFSQQLQDLYEEQIIQSDKRLQDLECGKERRTTLFSEIEKLEELLRNVERGSAAVKRGIFTAEELDQQLNCLKAQTIELGEIEGLASTLLKNSHNYHHELKICEQMYLNDILRSMKSKTSRLLKEQNRKLSHFEKIKSIYNEFQERISRLTQDQKVLRDSEPERGNERMRSTEEDFENKLQGAQNPISLPSDHWFQIQSYQELFQDVGLYWDNSAVKNLPKHSTNTAASHETEQQVILLGSSLAHHGKLLENIQLMIASVQTDFVALGGHFNPIHLGVICRKIKKIIFLIKENLPPDQPVVNTEEQKLRELGEKLDLLQQSLTQLMAISRAKERNKENILHRLRKTLADLKGTELQQSFIAELDINKLQVDLLRLEAIDEICKSDLQDLKSILELEKSLGNGEQFHGLNDLEKELEKSISQHIETLTLSCKTLQKFQDAIARVTECFVQSSQVLQYPVDLGTLQDGSEGSALLTNKKDLDVGVDEVHKVMEDLRSHCKPEVGSELDNIMCAINNNYSTLSELYERKQTVLTSCGEKYKLYKQIKRKMKNELEGMVAVLRDFISQLPMSYKAAWMQWEKSKDLVAKMYSYEEDLLKFKLLSRDLNSSVQEDSSILIDKSVMTLWDKWMYWLGVARDWELYCEDLKQEWKSVSEEIEREIILLDHFQEEAPDRIGRDQNTNQLLDLSLELKRFVGNVKMQQLHLSLLMGRIKNILSTSEGSMEMESIPITKEILSMKKKCKIFQEKAKKTDEDVQKELQDRDHLKEEMSVVKKSIQKVSTGLEDLLRDDPEDKKEQLEELQKIIVLEKEKANNLMEKLKIQYSGRVPADLSLLQEGCQTYLEETEDKVKNEVLQGCPVYVMTRKVEEVTTSLQSIETQLTNKSENIIKAKEFQQNIWDALDVCHSKLIALESEVQDLAEEDPSQAQEWMDKLMDPLNQYQQVSYLVERRSANLNKAASKLEEYEEIIKGTTSWLQNTDSLLNQEMKDCSAKVLSKHLIALEIALDDLGQKHSILEAIRSELGELALIFETDNITEQLDEISRQVRELLQRLMNILPHFQHVTNEVLFIEAEVKRIERNADTIKTILTSNDIVDMSPREHYKNGEVILENIESMKKTIAEIEDYKPDLSLAESGIQSLCVFRRTGQILKELAMYENATKQQNELLEPIISEMMELEQEQEKLRHLSKSMTHETADMKEKTENVKERLEGLNQKKEVVIESSRSSVTEEIERLQLESLEVESAAIATPVTEEKALRVNEELNTQAWVDSYYLPSLAEETEEDSFGTEAEDKASVASGRVILPEPLGDSSSSSSTVISDGSLQGDPGKTLADVKSEPEMILNDCQGRVTEVELWLVTVNLSLAAGEQDPEMHQTVKQQLADWQNTVEDIEKKVCALLESDVYINKGKGALLKEAESLSLKLKSLKTSLESVQAMLQVKSTDEKLSNEVPASSTTNDWLKQIDQEVNGEALTKTIVSETKLGESEPTDVSFGVRHLRSREKVVVVDNDYASQAATEDVCCGKWQYLQRDLSYRMKNINVPTVTKDVKIHVLPRFPVSAIKMAATEEPKNLTIQLDALTDEASIPRSAVKVGDQQKTLFLWLCSVSQWLQSVEDMLDVEVLSKEEATRQLAHCKKLSDDLHTLSTVMENKKETLLGSRGDVLTAVLPQCYDSVRTWLVKMQSTADLRAKSIQTELEKNNNYQNDIRQLYENLLKKKDDLVQHFNNTGSQDLTKRLQDAANYETELYWYENQASLLEKQRGGLHVPPDLYQDVHRSEDVLNDVWKILRTKQEEFDYVLANQSLLDALQWALVDLSAIGKEKVSLSKDHRSISKNGLATNVHNYKDFFRIFSSHVLLLETYSLKFSELVTGKEQRDHVLREATLLQGDAEECCVHMMSVLKDWQEFDSRYDGLRKELDALMSAVPSIGLVEETEEKVTGRLAQYQQIKGRIDAFEPRLCQIILEGKKLLTAVNCQELESQITTVEQNWSQLTKKVNHELHRLESLVRHLASYIKDSADLSLWLEWANQKLQIWKMMSLDASQDLETIRSNLTDFLEFTNDVDQKSSLKTSVLNTGSQLLRVKEADSTLLKVNLEKFEEKWANLIAALPAVQEKLQQLLMEKLPSWEAMHEVMSWMDQAKCDREPENDAKLPTTLSDVKSCLQECKDFKKRMNHKQWLVDYVNQSLLQLSVGDVEIKRYERNGFAERLGAMNLRWRQMQGNVGSKIQCLERILETFAEDDSRRQILSNWFDAQQQQLEKLRHPSSIPAAENMLADCAALEEQLLIKTASIEDLKSGFEVTDGIEHAPSEAGTMTQALLAKRDCVLNQVARLKSSMLTVLKKWKGFEENLDKANWMTIKILYLLQQCQPPAPSPQSLQSQLKRLKLMQEEVEECEEKWAQLNISLDNLRALCGPSVHSILHEKYEESTARWSAANQDLIAHIQSASSLLQLWEDYAAFYSVYSTSLGELEEKCDRLMYGIISEDNAAHSLQQRLQDLHDLRQSIQELKVKAEQVSELAEQVIRQDPAAVDVVFSERDTASHRMAHLERNIYSKTAELTVTMSEVDSFKRDLETLNSRVKASAGIIDQIHLPGRVKERNSEVIKEHLLQLSEVSTDVERLNEESFSIPLADHTLKTLQNLNRTWSKAEAAALEDCRRQRRDELEKNNFVQNYETWIQWLEKMEDGLNVGTAGNHQALKTQLQIYKRLQAEIAINEHILPSFVTKALNMLEKEGEDNRSEFISRLTALKEKWHSVVKLVQEREGGVTALSKRWWTFSKSKQRLEKHLAGIQNALTSVEGEKCHSLFHTKKLMFYFMDKQQQLRRCQSSYLSTVDACKDLQAIADTEKKETLESDLRQLQIQWESVSHRLVATIACLHAADVKRQGFQCDIQDRRKILHELKATADEPLPTLHEELMKAREPTKELEEALDEWNQSLKELDNMKVELSEYIVAEDGMFLRKQVEALHKQWEELCLRVSTRRQEIEDRLSAWTIFNEKNKQFCDWLTQMENKALQTADVNTEEMIEKLQKDFMEEINLFSENKNHLKQIGDQLIIASNKVRATEIDNKLQKISDRWQHLFDVTGSRVKRLKETLVVIQQLEKKMSNLRTWLAQIESELSKPVIYSICNDQEIHRKLTEQQDIQKDIELHSTGVASVLNICERLLHDTDSCPNETERDSIQQTTRSLDKRWRNICTMSMERRLRIEETWRLWQKFLEDYTRFEEWLQEAEAMAAAPDSSDVLYTKAKEEQKRFEAFQRQIHERLTHLELINKQYRRLARENRTDAASKLKLMVHDGNQRWDQLQKRVSSILRRLKHFTSQREEFEGSRDNILVWLTEIDLQLTNVEHFSESDIDDKMQRLAEFQQEITLKADKVDQLIDLGEQLIQKSEAFDAVNIEDELEELNRYYQEVFGRVSRFHQRLTNRDRQLEEERETSENDTDAEDSRELQNSSWHSTMHDVNTSHQSICHLIPPTLPHERSGRETPVSVDSIPLEWDPTVDVGGSSMHENEDEGTYYNALSDVEITENPEAYVIMTTKTVQASSVTDLNAATWHSDKNGSTRRHEYEHGIRKGLLSATAETNAPSAVEKYTSTEDQEPQTSSTSDQQAEDPGLFGFESPETHSGVIERWEIFQARSLSSELRAKQNQQRWQQLTSDLRNITLWLDTTESDLHGVRELTPASTLQELEQKARRLKDILRSFDNYKALVISANLSSKEFQQDEDSASRDALSRLHDVNTRWDQACCSRDEWRESLQSELIDCKEFHNTCDQLVLWLTEAEARRVKFRVAGQCTDPQILLESQKQLMQLKDQLLERQIKVNALRDLTACLLVKTSGDVYIEVEEKAHVIGNKANQLMKDVSDDLKSVQEALDKSASPDVIDSATTIPSESQTVGTVSQDTDRSKVHPVSARQAAKKPSFFYRVLRAAFPLQLFLLLLLLLACMIPFSEDDFSCTQANNFARSFYPMLRYMNGPPPT